MLRRFAKLILLILVLPPLLLGSFALRTYIIMPSFEMLEKNEAVKDIQRCTDAIERERHHLEILIKDWSVWDDTYKFVQDRNRDYIKSNLDWTVIEGKLKVNLLYICDNSGKVVWGGVHHTDQGGTITLQAFNAADLGRDHFAIRNLSTQKDFSGYLVTEHGLMLLATSRILPTSEQGPSAGVIMMGRFLDENAIKELNEQTKTSFSLATRPLAPGSEHDAQPAANPYPIHVVDAWHLDISNSLIDIDRAHRIEITARLPRLIYQDGLNVANYVVLATLIIYGVTGIFLFLLSHIGQRFTRLRKKDVIMGALANSANILISEVELEQGLVAVLDNLGNATRVSRTYIYENVDDGRQLDATMKIDWVNAAERQTLKRLHLERFRYAEAGLARWERELAQGNIVCGHVEDFPDKERAMLISLRVRSIAIVPIFIHNHWWGFIGLTECKAQRNWTDSELDALRLMAGTVGGAIERQRIELALKQAKEEAEAASRSKGDFLANMSHEIRTPMNGVIGMADLLMNTTLDTRQQKYAANIKLAAESLLTVINDVLDFSKIEAGQLSLEEIDFDLNELIGGIVELMALRANEKGLELLCHVKDGVPDFVGGDPARLRQVLTNLVGNAIKFTDHGEVGLQVSLESGNEAEARLRFAVHDTGIGIPPEKQGRIFDAFAQADSSVSRRFGGTGLGLSISSRLAQLMGGSIGVESDEGQGSTFWFTATLKKRTAPVTGVQPVSIMGKRVLVVDDNQTNREILLNLLHRWRCQADAAPDGATALRMILESLDSGKPYDLALIDYLMPGMSGEQFAERIRNDARLDAIHLIMLTSIGEIESTGYYKSKRIDARLTKPAKPNELLETIERVLGKRAMEQDHPGEQGGDSDGQPANAREACPKYRLLLAEDNEINQELILCILARAGLTADVAGDGAQAVAALKRYPDYDLILMDCQMPRLSGYDATVQIRRLEAPGRRIPIIAVTAHAMLGDRERCLAAGMDDYLTKPVDAERLIDRIFHWITLSRGRGSKAINCDRGRPAGAAGRVARDGARDDESPSRSATPPVARLLLVEDDEVLRELGEEILINAGFQVDMAPDGQRAVELARENDYDVILMDGHMPRMDGFTASRQIRNSAGKNARVPIITVTGSVSSDLQKRMKDAGMDDYVHKPYSSDQLLAKISFWLEKCRDQNPRPATDPAPGTQASKAPEAGGCPPIIDYPALQARCLGNEGLIRRLLLAFMAQIEDDLDRLRQALAANDAPEVAQVAHKIKGSAASLALETVRAGVAALEQQARAGVLEDGARYLAEIETAVDRVRVEIQRMEKQGD